MTCTFRIRVFVECVTFLMKHTDHEGLFRKAGSVSRQKSLRVITNNIIYSVQCMSRIGMQRPSGVIGFTHTCTTIFCQQLSSISQDCCNLVVTCNKKKNYLFKVCALYCSLLWKMVSVSPMMLMYMMWLLYSSSTSECFQTLSLPDT